MPEVEYVSAGCTLIHPHANQCTPERHSQANDNALTQEETPHITRRPEHLPGIERLSQLTCTPCNSHKTRMIQSDRLTVRALAITTSHTDSERGHARACHTHSTRGSTLACSSSALAFTTVWRATARMSPAPGTRADLPQWPIFKW